MSSDSLPFQALFAEAATRSRDHFRHTSIEPLRIGQTSREKKGDSWLERISGIPDCFACPGDRHVDVESGREERNWVGALTLTAAKLACYGFC